MSGLVEYLAQKKKAILARKSRLEQEERIASQQLKAKVQVAGRSGIREIRIRDYQIISDSGEDFAGFNLGPGSPELQLGVLGSCLSHITLIQAAERGVELHAIEVEVTGEMHPFAGRPGYEHIPVYLHNIGYTLQLTSPAANEDIAALHQAVELACPILNLLQHPQVVNSRVIHNKE
ncbi:osmotically inducible protein OsmC [Paenibacillus ferrarius]|uniref:Osmotically inducible protein OsmC n=1 Tax=Paenibacillus ferrarius TaxID=1469647 RepID=A0A1V4HN44_9BACL|nr:OsmC family protein [Paenibacillus ferrarius]OPH58908.1 osmotically inducible protein OsmC [Paenibacillus ferrarius]